MIQVRRDFKFDKSAVLVLLTSEQAKSESVPVKDKALLAELQKAVAAGQFEGNGGELFPAVSGKKLILFVGLGKEKDVNRTALCMAVRRALLSAGLKKVASLEILPHADTAEDAIAIIEAAVIGVYAWKKYVSVKKDDKSVSKKDIFVVASPREEYSAIVKVAENVNFARDLVNENADVVHSLFLEKVVRGIVRGKGNVSLEVLDRKKMLARKFGLLLAVNQGSNKEPRVLIARYRGAGKKEPYTAVVGKGLTFDSGGLNLKPTGHIETMRSDMSGAAAVIAVLKTALELKIKKNIIFACAIAENAIDANAYKPGDVVVGYSGKSVEIGNTDAEGRLVLADVLSYIVDKDKPARIIDIATLTGAVVVALGHDYSGLVSNNDSLAEELLASARATDDRLWRLPNYPELKDSMKSKIADIKNTSNWRGAGGTMTGAEFLRQFVDKTTWAHLDIAGTAFVDNDVRLYYGHGATGVGVRLLTHFFQNN
ncbi:MAG: leucyl aminopeptidase [Candidatus Omnitrophica bacterium]|nr:leucyl aminopeptidase [Candidatus Omnitrophota bacterium]